MMLSSTTNMGKTEEAQENFPLPQTGVESNAQFYTSGMSGKLLSTVDRGAITIKDGDTFLSNPGPEAN